MEIYIAPHTLERASLRGASRDEIVDVLTSGFEVQGKYKRFGKAIVYEFQQYRQNKYYEQKRVEVYYTIENGVIITVTVYVFYGKREAQDADSV